ncbi:MAG: hypothetical protein NXI24_06770 [bacterium]|nr:hypothetical protein [bacterium]
MKNSLILTGLLAALLAVTAASAVFAEEVSGEQILEECILEAHNRGYDIEDDDFAEGLAEIIEAEDEEAILEVCPNTYKKYPD